MQSYLRDHIRQEGYEENPIPLDYSPYTKNQVNRIIRLGVNDQAVSRKKVEWISIDDINSPDLDDAIWAERTKDGYSVWIHISDVTETIPIFSPLDLEALQRTTSVYLKDKQIDMIPKSLSHFDLSLHAWEPKLTLTLQIELDNEANIKSSLFYESEFNNTNRYDYDTFQIDAKNPDSKYFNTLTLLSEISDKLRFNRRASWGLMDYEEWTRHKWRVGNHHKIIESLMVLANQTTWLHLLDAWKETIYKRHDSLNEMSFYRALPSFHTWLQIYNYTQFTSPIRRYIDIVNHRIIKSLLRNQENPYQRNDLLFIAEHMNNTRLKLNILGSQIRVDDKWWEFLKKARDRLERDLEVYDMKDYIRNCTHKNLKLPLVMRHAIEKKIESGNISNWIWWAGTLLLWKDNDIKKSIRKQIIEKEAMSKRKFLSVIAQTQVLRWAWSIFEINEKQDAQGLSMEIIYKWVPIAKSHDTWKNKEDIRRVHNEMRTDIINQLFNHFIE